MEAAGQRTKPERRATSTRTHLIVLTAVVLAPIVIAAVGLAVGFSMDERARYQAVALETARRASTAVDRQLLAFGDGLLLLRSAVAQTPDDPAQLSDSIADTADILGTRILLVEDGNVRIDSRTARDPRIAAAAPAPRLGADGTAPPVEISFRDLDIVDGLPVVTLSLAISDVLAGASLAMQVPASRLTAVLGTEALPEDWIGALVDRNDVIVARSRAADRFVGATATDDLRARTKGASGVWTGFTKEGTPVLSAYVRSPVTGWRVAVGVPVETVEKPLRRTLAILAAAAAASLTVALAAAFWMAGRMTRAMGVLADAAVALGQSVPLRPPSETGNREVNLIGRAISGAAAELAKRAEARNRAEEALAAANARLERVLDHSPVGIVEVDPSGAVRFANATACRLVGFTPVHGGDEARWLPPARPPLGLDGQPLPMEARPVVRALAGETVTGLEHQVEDADGGRRVLSVNAIPIRSNGAVEGALAVFHDVTERHAVEIHQRLLINELNHRVKNTLATVNSIAAQSLRTTRDTDAAREAFTGRIVALAQAHDVLTRERWEGADLTDVVAGAVAPHGGDRFDLTGVPVRLGPQTALSFAMALHELATNAVKYGALSGNDGRVAIGWTVEPREDGRHLLFRWKEHGGPPVVVPERRGFGSRMIEQGLSRELGGTVRIHFEADGLLCLIDAPLPGGEREG